MKIRKTRIKKETKANGSIVYTAEYKWGFWWYSFTNYENPPKFKMWEYFSYWSYGKEDLKQTEQEAKSLIDFYISTEKHKQVSKIENTIVKTEYAKYP